MSSYDDGVMVTKYVTKPTTCSVDTGAGPNLVNNTYLQLQRRKGVQKLPMPKRRPPTKQVISAVGVLPLITQMEDRQVLSWLGGVEELALDVL